MLVSVQVSALAEAMALAARAGVDPKVAAGLIEGSAFFSGSVKAKLPRMLEHRYDTPDFMLSLMLKDTRYATAMARQFGLDFIRLLTEDYFFVCRRAFLETEPMQRVLEIMKGREFHDAVAMLPGYIAVNTGTVSTVPRFLDSVEAKAIAS